MNPIASLRPDEEILRLIETLIETERRLVELTAGEVDAVAGEDGRTFMLQRAQEELRHREAAKQHTILNALPAHVALLDQQGLIISVNDAWRRFGRSGGLPDQRQAEGVNYLAICDGTEGPGQRDAQAAAAGIRAVLAGTAREFSLEYPCSSPAAPGWFLMMVSPLKNAHVHGAVVMHVDITERKRAEEAKRESDERFAGAFEQAPIGVALVAPDGRWLRVNRAVCDIVGYTEAELTARTFQDITHPADLAKDLDQVRRMLVGEINSYQLEKRYVHARGHHISVLLNVSLVHDSKGRPSYFISQIQDITERRLAEIALRASEVEFRTLAESMPQIVWITRPDGWNIYFNQQWMDYTGLTLEESSGQGWIKPFHPEDQPMAWAAWQQAVATTGTYSIAVRLRRADGVYRWWLTRGVPVRDAAGTVIKWFGTCTDIHELKTAELKISLTNQALGAAEAKYRAIFENSTEGIFQSTADGRLISANPALARMLGFASPEELIRERTDVEAQGDLNPAQRNDFKRRLEEQGFINGYEYEILRKDGAKIWVSKNVRLVPATAGQAEFYEGSMRDITERKTAVDALRESEMRFKALFEQAAVGVAQTDAVTGRYLQVNRRFCQIVGRGPEEMEQLTFAQITHPEDVAHTLDMTQQLRAGTLHEFTQEKRYVQEGRPDVWANVTVSAMWATGEKPDYFIVVAQDITQRKQLEVQLRQAHKLEAVGTLAGGIAHDFNNILAAIGGYTELARMQLTDNPGVRGHLDSVMKTVKRAADLVRQILAFSREQPLERRLISLQPVVTECVTLIQATLPPTIQLKLEVAQDAPTVLADETQVLQVLMNLGTNARQALGDRPGRIGVKVENCLVDEAHPATQLQLRPGRYVRIAVSDTGDGMAPETMRRIFEPFFTTKGPGKGTGLGLAVVHGIMDGHDGLITVDSQPGEGTVFRLYFPAHVTEEALAPSDATTKAQGRGKRVLLVDDEKMFIEMLRMALGELGYAVEGVTQPVAALELVRAAPGRFALVITDQVMPVMTGMQLAVELRQIRPDLPIILTTGHSLTTTVERVKAAGVDQLLLKPITLHSLESALQATFSGQTLTTHASNPPY